MKLIFTLIFTCGVFLNAFAQESSMKVITYNIWNGYDWGKMKNAETV